MATTEELLSLPKPGVFVSFHLEPSLPLKVEELQPIERPVAAISRHKANHFVPANSFFMRAPFS
jgi:hypothetical protein